jgi:hypothetical protein
MAGPSKESRIDTYKNGRNLRFHFKTELFRKIPTIPASIPPNFLSCHSVVVLPALVLLSIPVSKRMLAGEDHVVVAVMLLTSGGQLPSELPAQDVSHGENAGLTLAVAVAGCASTVGVRALTAATHVD